MRPSLLTSIKKDARGLSMVLASLLVIGLITVMLFQNNHSLRMDAIRDQGVSLVRVLSSMETLRLMPDNKSGSPLELLSHSIDTSDFAYASIVEPNGTIIEEHTGSGVFVPVAAMPERPTDWFGERLLELKDGGRRVIEFHAPLLQDGALAGFVRLGYFEPTWGLGAEQLRLIGTIALPVFLLVPLFYYPMRREFNRLNDIGEALEDTLQGGSLQKVELTASGEMAQFIDRFNHYVSEAEEKVHSLEKDNEELEINTRLLNYNRERLETVLQSLPDGVVALDDTGKISYMNSRAAVLFGCNSAEAIGHPPGDWASEDLRTFMTRFNGQSSAANYSHRINFESDYAPDKVMEMRAYPLFSRKEDGALLGTLLHINDITEENLARKHRSEFVAHVAHELKTPLNVLSLYSETLMDQGDEPEFRTEAINVISDEVERLSMLINNLLRLSEFETGTMRIERRGIKLLDLLNDTCDSVSRSAEDKGLQIERNLPREFSPVQADKEMMRIAVTNLLTNAIKYNTPGGKVILSTEEHEDRIEISVKDTGIGIQPEDRAFIFEKFFRSDSEETRQRSGHGLGLPLAKEIVEMHHGTINVESEVGEGTCFTIVFNKNTGILGQVI